MTSQEMRAAVTDRLPLIVSLAREMSPTFGGRVELHDLISFGAEGAMKALRRYDPSKGRITTFLYRRIKGAMIDGVRSQSESRHIRERRQIARKIAIELTQRLGYRPSRNEVLAEVKTRGYRWQATPFTRGRTFPILNRIARYRKDAAATNPYKTAEINDTYDFLTRDLDERDKLIVHLRVHENRTLHEIGKAVGLSEAGARVRWERIRLAMIEKLKAVA